jgi:hypothetical protein
VCAFVILAKGYSGSEALTRELQIRRSELRRRLSGPGVILGRGERQGSQ